MMAIIAARWAWAWTLVGFAPEDVINRYVDWYIAKVRQRSNAAGPRLLVVLRYAPGAHFRRHGGRDHVERGRLEAIAVPSKHFRADPEPQADHAEDAARVGAAVAKAATADQNASRRRETTSAGGLPTHGGTRRAHGDPRAANGTTVAGTPRRPSPASRRPNVRDRGPARS